MSRPLSAVVDTFDRPLQELAFVRDGSVQSPLLVLYAGAGLCVAAARGCADL